MAIIKKSNFNSRRGCGEKETLVYFWCECKLVWLLQKTLWSSWKTISKTSIWSRGPSVCERQQQSKQQKSWKWSICSLMFIAKLFTIINMQNQHGSSSTGKYRRKHMACVYKEVRVSLQKGANTVICNNMNEPGGH